MLTGSKRPRVPTAQIRISKEVINAIADEVEKRIVELLTPHAGLPKRKATHDYALSGREAQVLQLLADGLTNTEIAGILDLSKETVKNHVVNILAKLGARNRTEGVAFAFRNKLVK